MRIRRGSYSFVIPTDIQRNGDVCRSLSRSVRIKMSKSGTGTTRRPFLCANRRNLHHDKCKQPANADGSPRSLVLIRTNIWSKGSAKTVNIVIPGDTSRHEQYQEARPRLTATLTANGSRVPRNKSPLVKRQCGLFACLVFGEICLPSRGTTLPSRLLTRAIGLHTRNSLVRGQRDVRWLCGHNRQWQSR